ncbi:39S ribosomal protein L36, mitochondrial [Octodon degus]|uniref:Ribosomal protein n=1 Tax=Octodon degus TaxID=10160 RepID=A0A6P3ET53_OCTDE|nr:39S ribosomal protein L36, mitochondrial [Octodon degus]
MYSRPGRALKNLRERERRPRTTVAGDRVSLELAQLCRGARLAAASSSPTTQACALSRGARGAGPDIMAWTRALCSGSRALAAPLIRTVLASVTRPQRLLRSCPGPTRALSSVLAGTPGPRALLPPHCLPPQMPTALGFKTKAVLRKRCRDCYMVKRNGRWYVLCKTNPKHKQRQML